MIGCLTEETFAVGCEGSKGGDHVTFLVSENNRHK